MPPINKNQPPPFFCSSPEIKLNDVWDYAFVGDSSTVTVHMRRLREKIERDPARPGHLLTVWGVGYKFGG